MLGIETEKSVIVPEAHQCARRKLFDPLGRAGPDSSGHRREIPLEEIVSISPRFHIVAQGDISKCRVGEFGDRLAVEAGDLRQHPPVAEIQQVLPLAEEQVQAATVEFQPVRHVLHAEGHRSRLRLNPELAEQAREKRVGHLVINHESRIYWDLGLPFVHHHRVRVASAAVVHFKDCHVMFAAEKPSRSQTGDPGSHDGDPFAAHALCGWLRPSVSTACGTGRRSQISPVHDRNFRP